MYSGGIFFKVYYNNKIAKIMRNYEELIEFAKTHNLQEIYNEIFPWIFSYHTQWYEKDKALHFSNPVGYHYTRFMTLHHDSTMLGDNIGVEEFQRKLQSMTEEIRKKFTFAQEFELEAIEDVIELNFKWVEIDDEARVLSIAKHVTSELAWKFKNTSDNYSLYSSYNVYYQYFIEGKNSVGVVTTISD